MLLPLRLEIVLQLLPPSPLYSSPVIGPLRNWPPAEPFDVSPMPAMMTLVLAGSKLRLPIESEDARSVSGVQVAPLSVVRQMPPLVEPTKMRFGLFGSGSTA